MADYEASIGRYIGRWTYLMGLEKWSITWEVVDEPIDSTQPVAHNRYVVRRDGKRVAHLRFDRHQIDDRREAEEAVIHELLHLIDHSLRPADSAHALIYRLESVLRNVRIRATRGEKR